MVFDIGGFYSVFDSERFNLVSEGSFFKPKLWLRSCALLSRPSLSATFSAKVIGEVSPETSLEPRCEARPVFCASSTRRSLKKRVYIWVWAVGVLSPLSLAETRRERLLEGGLFGLDGTRI